MTGQATRHRVAKFWCRVFGHNWSFDFFGILPDHCVRCGEPRYD